MWVVIIAPGRHFGQVGKTTGADHRSGTAKIEVQFGSSGPFQSYARSSILGISNLIKQIEQNTGSKYNWRTDE